MPCIIVVATLVVATSACAAQVGAEADTATIAFLRAVPSSGTEEALLDELRAAGYVKGRTLEVLAADREQTYPEPEAAAAAVREWVAGGVDLIIAMSTSGALTARTEAPDTNVLFLSNDPEATGLVRDEQRPEGRLTGVTFRVPSDRTLTLLQRVLPEIGVIGLPFPADDPAAMAHRDAVTAAAEQLELTVLTEEFTDGDDVAAAVDRLVDDGAEAIMLSSSPAAVRALDQTHTAVSRHGMPVVANAPSAEFALLALYPDSAELQRQMGRQAARLLAGSSPSAVPVEDPRRFIVRVNAVAGAALDIEIPRGVQREADEVVAP